jgi:hypothetical protein
MARRKSRAPRRQKAENHESSVPPPVAAETSALPVTAVGESPSEETRDASPANELDQLDAGWD